jgi:hypothetical protein
LHVLFSAVKAAVASPRRAMHAKLVRAHQSFQSALVFVEWGLIPDTRTLVRTTPIQSVRIIVLAEARLHDGGKRRRGETTSPVAKPDLTLCEIVGHHRITILLGTRAIEHRARHNATGRPKCGPQGRSTRSASCRTGALLQRRGP